MDKLSWIIVLAFNFLFGLNIYSQDLIIKKSGDTLRVKVLETGLSEVKYKNYDDLDGITYGIYKSAIATIRYVNGRVESFDQPEEMSAEKKCYCGNTDAAKYHGKKGGHFVLGALFGPFAMIGTAFANPIPRKGRHSYLSKYQELFNDPAYKKCYKKKAKSDLIGMEAAGWGAWIAFVFLTSQ